MNVQRIVHVAYPKRARVPLSSDVRQFRDWLEEDCVEAGGTRSRFNVESPVP